MESDCSGLDVGQQEGWFTIHLVSWEGDECVTSVLLRLTQVDDCTSVEGAQPELQHPHLQG